MTCRGGNWEGNKPEYGELRLTGWAVISSLLTYILDTYFWKHFDTNVLRQHFWDTQTFALCTYFIIEQAVLLQQPWCKKSGQLRISTALSRS